ncbi:MAG: hypothetical protein Q9M36_03160 [Sulfurovum sp.]|nr:hypothetical protein [Sulfurovum sp.]
MKKKQKIFLILLISSSILFQGCESAGLCIGPVCWDEDGDVTDIVSYITDDNECDVSGASDLRSEHEEILIVAGWYDYVHDNIDKIKYKNVELLDHDSPAIGLAHCEGGSSCYIQVATQDRSALNITRIIVHEAAHLKDNCEHGEEPAEKAGSEFLKDYAENTE